MGTYGKRISATTKLTAAQNIGQSAEKRACDYLLAKGLTFIKSHHLCKMGEIDLIMKDKDVLVFVEVRYRKSSVFGSAAESVTFQKQQKLRRAAEHYLLGLHGTLPPCRFDVVAITSGTIDWIKNAF